MRERERERESRVRGEGERKVRREEREKGEERGERLASLPSPHLNASTKLNQCPLPG